MIKQALLTIALLICITTSVFANLAPVSSEEIPAISIGVYQVSCSKLIIYAKPDEQSKVIYEESIDYSKYLDTKTSPIFCVMIPKKQLSYLYATDCYDDWVEVIYNKPSNSRGWVKKDDIFQFLPWVNFYSMYGRKYGLVELQGKNHSRQLHSQADKNSQIISESSKPIRIRLTALEGNWALVSILDITGAIHTGYLEWRNHDGKYFVFPEFK